MLKIGGCLVIATPFMFHIHGSPDDYFRYTESALKKTCQKAGFSNVKVINIGTGLFSLIAQTIVSKLKNHTIKSFIQYFFITIDNLLGLIPVYASLVKTIPLGYFVVAKK